MNEREGEAPLSPEELARAYDRFVSARWRGEDESADTLATWFEGHWIGQAPPEPDDPPEGSSILGGAGGGIRWYARGDVVLGYGSPRTGGCYRVATAEAVPTLVAPWDDAPAPRPTADRLLHHVGASPVAARSTGAEREQATGGHGGQREVIRAQHHGSLVPNERDRHVHTDSRAGDEDEDQPTREPAREEAVIATHVLKHTAGGDQSGAASGM